MRRYVPLLIAGSAFIVAACRDAIAPTRSTADSDLPTIAAFGGGSASSAVRANDKAENSAATFTFKLNPQGGRLRIRGFTVDYPAHAVCDPNKSDYGPTEWNKPCATLNHTITVRAKFWVEDHRSHSDFAPDIRFNPDKNVYISTIIPDLRGKPDDAETHSQFAIWYSTRRENTRYLIDDAAGDPSLVTHYDLSNGVAWRKIQHFSGYFVQWGTIWCEDGSELNDPLCDIIPQ